MYQVLTQPQKSMMLRYFQRLAENLLAKRAAPKTLEEWEDRRPELRRQIWESAGRFPLESRPPLNPRITGTIDHGDHVVEKVVYESLPGLYVTALIYVPKNLEGKAPAVLSVNGHWPQSKATEHIQRRCAALARMGVVAFCQDVIGTGERAIPTEQEPAWYHGLYRGAAPWIVGKSLFGYIMYECLRALDYVASRPEVDSTRVMCTGSSGGGKQSMFFAALDDRLAGAVPVVYICSYEQHIGATGCVGEVPLGILGYTDQWELLGMHAPRPLLCISASQDVSWFLPKHMFRMLGKAREGVYALYGARDLVRGEEVDCGHDYNQTMREMLYNHVARHLQGVTRPHVVEPEDLPVESEDALRCGLPAESETVLSLTYRDAQQLVDAIPQPINEEQWQTTKRTMVRRLKEEVLGGFPEVGPLSPTRMKDPEVGGSRVEHWMLETEPGIVVPAVFTMPESTGSDGRIPAVVVIDEEGKQSAFDRGLVAQLTQAGFVTLAIDYRGTGETTEAVSEYSGISDYNLSNYSLYVGHPLAGMRAFDVQRSVEFIASRPEVDPSRIALVGRGMGALAGVLTAAFDERVAAVATEEMLATWVLAEEFSGLGLSYLIPRILKVGDLGHLAACLAPRPLLMLNAIDGRRRALEEESWNKAVRFTKSVYSIFGADQQLRRGREDQPAVPNLLVEWLTETFQHYTR